MILMLGLVVMVVMVVVVVVTPVAVVKVGVRMSPVVVFRVATVVSIIMRRVSPIKLVFPSYLLETLPRLFRR